MRALFDSLRRDARGNAVLELAFVLPFLVLLLSGFVEVGRVYFQANAVEKGLRAGAFYAARQAVPLAPAARVAAENLVRTGTLDGSGAPLVSGWTLPGAGVVIDDGTVFAVGDTQVPVLRLTATVPFDPILPGLMSFAGLGEYTMSLSHEQAHVGD